MTHDTTNAAVTGTTHVLKLWLGDFQAALDGTKTFELYREDDCQFEVGDRLILREYLPELVELAESTGDEAIQYTGRQIKAEVTYVLRRNEQWLQPGVACLGIRVVRGGLRQGYPSARLKEANKVGWCWCGAYSAEQEAQGS